MQSNRVTKLKVYHNFDGNRPKKPREAFLNFFLYIEKTDSKTLPR